jgi:hypothetical protein
MNTNCVPSWAGDYGAKCLILEVFWKSLESIKKLSFWPSLMINSAWQKPYSLLFFPALPFLAVQACLP